MKEEEYDMASRSHISNISNNITHDSRAMQMEYNKSEDTIDNDNHKFTTNVRSNLNSNGRFLSPASSQSHSRSQSHSMLPDTNDTDMILMTSSQILNNSSPFNDATREKNKHTKVDLTFEHYDKKSNGLDKYITRNFLDIQNDTNSIRLKTKSPNNNRESNSIQHDIEQNPFDDNEKTSNKNLPYTMKNNKSNNNDSKNSLLPLESFDDEDEEDEHEDPIENENNNNDKHSTATYQIPKLRKSLTPWRNKDKQKRTDNYNNTAVSSPTRSINAKPFINSSNHNNSEGNVMATSSSNVKEIEFLQKQLTSYKLQQKTLYEVIIHQLNQNNTDSNNGGNKLYENLLSNISKNDEQVEKLKKIIKDKENQLENSNNELTKIKNEYSETLNYANEYLQHSEIISQSIDDLLNLIVENAEFLQIDDNEKNTLIKATQINSTFIMVKLNSLTSILKNLISNQLEKDASIVKDQQTNNNNSNTTIDTKLEINIESLHKQYDKFLNGIKFKLSSSQAIENALYEKLSNQFNLLNQIQQYIQESNNDTGEKESQIIQLEKELNLLEKKLNNEKVNNTKLMNLKEENWQDLIGQLENDIEYLTSNKDDLTSLIDELSKNIEHLRFENDDISSLVKQLTEEKRNKDNDFSNLLVELNDMKLQNNNLQNIIENLHSNANITNEKNELEFDKLKQHLLLHLNKNFEIFERILQKKSIDQSKKKIEFITKNTGLKNVKLIQPKLESLYNFIETALKAITDAYITLLTQEKQEKRSNDKRVSSLESEDAHEYYQRETQLRIEELERKWISERERRKLDANAAESRIRRLEEENQLLREQLYVQRTTISSSSSRNSVLNNNTHDKKNNFEIRQ
ncbi:gamma-tubulin complex subunit SPC72 NDAI_0H01950 [Naumovozyma dairenensis CBS 421]|uniref:Mto1-like Mto2p-binding domain-containing protein n=1 Tax=Naumovozyma dairenensis (strain ATCC 10597 / BCRC 20456 / CBS 421 / NBRC 0211 / NRRL Y-12639) TaxID=1071378 RepID=G0WF08_NAUDC|nr:hypothetical protein NDAI_0H01950 [Naumovozyma dairenensis CBS 421]CCD26369.1 hypothetical protein NDAI_0H01950 [Naumovozyma dairenensis CBS 421]